MHADSVRSDDIVLPRVLIFFPYITGTNHAKPHDRFFNIHFSSFNIFLLPNQLKSVNMYMYLFR